MTVLLVIGAIVFLLLVLHHNHLFTYGLLSVIGSAISGIIFISGSWVGIIAALYVVKLYQAGLL